jgi:hypothetical protein
MEYFAGTLELPDHRGNGDLRIIPAAGAVVGSYRQALA